MFIVDMEGGQGKSFLTDYFIAKENAIAFDNGVVMKETCEIVMFDYCVVMKET
jgi:hypothetical protein